MALLVCLVSKFQIGRKQAGAPCKPPVYSPDTLNHFNELGKEKRTSKGEVPRCKARSYILRADMVFSAKTVELYYLHL